ncbi:MAG: hypothetical protein DHS20C17_28180 [Cyclobacteriaceae bacterium]|nr:MAG: hypothetical protein DHS20C17_28180 [Cyclobacteriaceae bacterium]
MKYKLLSLLGFFLTALGLQASTEYALHFSSENPRIVNIEARLLLHQPRIAMPTGGVPSDIPDGWAAFVHLKSIRLISGEKISYKSAQEKSSWLLEMDPGQEIVIEYQVQLEHDRYNWNQVGGQDARPSLLPGPSTYWVTKGLFIIPANADFHPNAIDPVTVSFSLPAHWNASTAWVAAQKGGQKYNVQNFLSLTNNALMVGNHAEKTVQHQGMTITWAVSADLSHRTDLFVNTLGSILPVYHQLFGELPTTNYLICATVNSFEDGEAFNNSFHQMFTDQDLEFRKVVWANVLAHEMFHYWNGTYFLRGKDIQGHYWFSEGFTEYYSNLALVRAGIVNESTFLQKMSFQFSRYYNSKFLQPPPHPNLVEAGYNKNNNWGLIYGGGATTAFVLDVQIRFESDGEHSLDEVMRYLYEHQGKSHTPVTQQHLIEAIKVISGKDYSEFLRSYVNGLEVLPLITACEQSGLSMAYYQGEFYLESPQHSNEIIKSIMAGGRLE